MIEDINADLDECCVCDDIAEYHGPDGKYCSMCMYSAVEEGRAEFEDFDMM